MWSFDVLFLWSQGTSPSDTLYLLTKKLYEASVSSVFIWVFMIDWVIGQVIQLSLQLPYPLGGEDGPKSTL